ncbi:hypothetical protein P5P86_01390 [Nocardioides sp. BP30]|uniref:HAD family acid phosphatase n=1 Tax=Nocardioides sp. BP30 TaxID=3036374 RepID=UPI00246974BE|nr:HAD family acid phosphatase [Nocardioides sp. BP30]WGL52494.1 hypothetical protein P5P86_01390 [Nocardioides sp. BP30]
MTPPGRTPRLRPGRRLHAALALMACALLTACAVDGPADLDLARPLTGSPEQSSARIADDRMPPAPQDERAWLRAVDHAYSSTGGHGAEAWLRHRMAHRGPGERLAVVMGIDDVMVQTHFGGIGALVPRSVRFVRAAHDLGYSIFYVTGRRYGDSLLRIEARFDQENVPANAVYARPVGATNEQSAKAQCRAAIQAQGYTLAMSVAADGASFSGAPRPEKEVRLPDFAKPA